MWLSPKQKQRKKTVEAEVWEDKMAPWESEYFISTSNTTFAKSLDFHPNRPNTRLPHLTCTLLVPETAKSPLWIIWFSAFDAHEHTGTHTCTHKGYVQIHLRLWGDNWRMFYYCWWLIEALLYKAQKSSYVKEKHKDIQTATGCSYLHIICINASCMNNQWWFGPQSIQLLNSIKKQHRGKLGNKKCMHDDQQVGVLGEGGGG